jgi:hypothetical protein
MASSRPDPSVRIPTTSPGTAQVALASLFALALLALIWGVALAERTFEPCGDSPRAVYAVFADVLLGIGTTLVALALHQSRRQLRAWRIPTWLELLVYIASCVAVAIPLSIGASNSVQASSIGEGGPSFPLVVLGGISLTAALALLLRRGVRLGLTAAILLGGVMTTYALIAAR